MLGQNRLYRWIWVALLTYSALFAAYALEGFARLQPCALCLVQRWLLMALAFVASLACLKNGWAIHRRLSLWLSLLLSMIGVAASVFQLLRLYLPSKQSSSCSADLSYLVQYASFSDTVHAFLQGLPDCVQHQGFFLGTPLALWALLVFVCLIAVHIWPVK